jgi:hypothetical protein
MQFRFPSDGELHNNLLTLNRIESASRMTCAIRIGTSGFHYKHWKGPFYPPKPPASQMLDYYIRQFDTVELNNPPFARTPGIRCVA